MVFDHEKFTPQLVLHLIEKHKITSFCAPPTVFRFMIREDMSHYDLSSLEYATTAGEALNPSVFEAFYKGTGIKTVSYTHLCCCVRLNKTIRRVNIEKATDQLRFQRLLLTYI